MPAESIHHRKGTKQQADKISHPVDLSQPLTLGIQYWYDGNKSKTAILAEIEIMHGLLLTMGDLASFYLVLKYNFFF